MPKLPLDILIHTLQA